MTSVDRLNGVNSGLAYKAPVKAATTANITLSGEQTIATVSCTDGDYVLVKDQSTASQNGIYVVSTGAWTRRTDFDGNRDIVKGTRVRVTDGSNAGVYEVSSSNPITIDSSSISFTAVDEGLDVSAYILTLLDDATAEAARTTLLAQRQRVTDPRDSAYGVTFDGTTDDTAAWNLLIAALNAGTVKVVLCPPATSLISATLTAITASDWAIIGDGFAVTTLQMAAGAGTTGKFLQIGNSTTEARRWVISGIEFECLNFATLNGSGNAIDVQNSTEGFISRFKCSNTNGFVTIGNTANTTQSSRLKIDHGQVNAYAPAGGISVDVQNQSGTKISIVNFAGLGGTAPASFRGIKVHPGADDAADNMKCVNCEWNYNGPDPLYNIEYDVTNNSVGNQTFLGCVFDQAVTGANIYVHCDASPENGALFAGFFNGCISNGSTDATCILIDNTGDKPISLHWTGGQLTSAQNGALGKISVGQANLTVSNSYLRNRSATPGEAAFIVASGASGLSLVGNTVERTHSASTGAVVDSYDYLVRFQGAASRCLVAYNDATECEVGVADIAGLAGTEDDIIIKDNLGPVTGITATADGLTTGLIPAYHPHFTVTSANANNIITLPAAVVGMKLSGYIGATGCEMRTPASSGATINNVDSDGTNEAAIPATTYFEVECVADDTWILKAWTEGGAALTITPDAA